MSYGVGEKLQICDREHDAITFVARHDSDCPLCAIIGEKADLEEELERQKDTYEKQLADMNEDLYKANTCADGIQTSLDDAEARANKLQAEVDKLTAECDNLRSERDSLMRQLETPNV